MAPVIDGQRLVPTLIDVFEAASAAVAAAG